MNLFSLAKAFPSEEHALAYWCKVRWPKGVRCLACDHDKCYLIETKGKTGKPARLFECAECKLHFSATTGTLFHDSHLPLQKWFMAIALMVEAKKGVSAKQVQRHIGCAYKTAWYLCQRIRQAMQEDSGSVLGGTGTVVEIDETYIGGRVAGSGVKAGRAKKVKVIGIVERGGRVHMQTVKDTTKASLQPVIEAKVNPDIHDQKHRQRHEITCVKGDHFPPCPKCGNKATFRLKTAAHHLSEHPAFRSKT